MRRAPAALECVYSLSTSARLSWCFADGVNDVPRVLQDTEQSEDCLFIVLVCVLAENVSVPAATFYLKQD